MGNSLVFSEEVWRPRAGTQKGPGPNSEASFLEGHRVNSQPNQDFPVAPPMAELILQVVQEKRKQASKLKDLNNHRQLCQQTLNQWDIFSRCYCLRQQQLRSFGELCKAGRNEQSSLIWVVIQYSWPRQGLIIIVIDQSMGIWFIIEVPIFEGNHLCGFFRVSGLLGTHPVDQEPITHEKDLGFRSCLLASQLLSSYSLTPRILLGRDCGDRKLVYLNHLVHSLIQDTT